MGGLLSDAPVIKKKQPPLPPPVPTVDEDKVGTEAKKKLPRGRLDTFLTGALVPSGESRGSGKLGGGR